jgi:uncharacterized protein YkwD
MIDLTRPRLLAPPWRWLLLGCMALLALAPTAEAAATPDLAETVRRIVERTNQLRRAQRLPATANDAALTSAARQFAEYMARTERYGHEADGRTPAQRADAAGYAACRLTENIAFQMNSAGFTTRELADGLFEGWADSAGHRLNMLDADAVDTGVAIAYSTRSARYYAVQVFGRPMARMLRYRVQNDTERPVVYAVGERRYTLPGYTVNTHQECNADRLRLWTFGDSARAADEGLAPAADATYRIELSGGALRMSRE